MMPAMASYPNWRYFPASDVPPQWVTELTEVFSEVQEKIDTAFVQGLKSDGILDVLCPGLQRLGYVVETGKTAIEKIERPVLFGDQGVPRVHYQIDAWLPDEGVVVEIEAGRGWQGGAFYRDLIRTSLIVGARYLVIGMMDQYVFSSGGKKSAQGDYAKARDQLDAIYASGRLQLPFEGVLLVGY